MTATGHASDSNHPGIKYAPVQLIPSRLLPASHDSGSERENGSCKHRLRSVVSQLASHVVPDLGRPKTTKSTDTDNHRDPVAGRLIDHPMKS